MSRQNILFFLLGDRRKASSRVRGFWVAEELENMGMRCEMVCGEDRGSFFRCLKKLFWCHILIIQKRCSRWDYYVLQVARLLGRKIIFDMDDAYSNVNNPRTLFNIERIMKAASAVTVGSHNLLAFAKQFQENAFYLPTSIRVENYALPGQRELRQGVCLGWIGNGAHYYRDLITILKPPLTELANDRNIRFKIVGACGRKELYQEFSNIPGLAVEFVDEVDWGDASAVRGAMMEFDIGLYPVRESDFNLYKCGFKALEYMAMGMPVVASPVGANGYIVENGKDGFHAAEDRDWIDALNRLIADPGLRDRMGRAGRDKVEAQYSISGSARKLRDIMGRLGD